MAKERDSTANAHWDNELQNIFCDISISEIEIGNRPTTYFNKEGWKNIANKFHEATGLKYTKTQFKNKWDHFKKEWKLWKELKRGSTGLGWDPKKKTIAASDTWWKEKLELVPLARKFRFGGIEPELENKLDLMFEGVVARGRHFDTTFTVDLCDENDKGKGVVGETSNDISNDSNNNINANAESSHSKRPSSSSLKARASKKGNANEYASIDKLISAVTSIGEGRKKREAEAKDPFSLEAAIQTLNGMDDVVSDRDLYIRAVKLMNKKGVRTMFMSIIPDSRRDFLNSFFTQ